ncbi:MAG TPA: tRNA1(Val) (adenine(37)-N6)-methyltransferase [candidate division Zixibacteria bacterium]|nr:tRNA1(Val) (adenine(37)-N6)-methyltransferase [candidate division Zixibacteria bacterium]
MRDDSLDTIFNGRLKLYQSRSGYRFSLDSVLLAHFATVRATDRVADLGSGNGAVALMLAHLQPEIRVTGIETQERMVERARRNVRLNGCADRVEMTRADVREVRRRFPPGAFTAVVSNPPYRRATSGRVSPDEEKRIARHETCGNLADFLSAGAYLLPDGGRMALVYPAPRSVDLLAGMRAAGLEPKRVRLVYSRSGSSEASLILAEGVKGGRSGTAILPPLHVYEREKHYTAEVAAMLAGSRIGAPATDAR